MKDLFSLKRFGLLLRKFIKEHLPAYLLYLGGLTGILLLVYGLTVLSLLNTKFEQDAAIIYFVFGILFMASLFASSFYSFFGNKAKGIQYVNLPASPAEKILLGFLFTQVVFFTCFIALFYGVDQLMVLCYNQFHTIPTNTPRDLYPMFHARPVDFSEPFLVEGFKVALVCSAVCHFGALGFEKNAFVKNVILVIIVGAIIFLFSYHSMKDMIKEEVMPGGGFFYNQRLRVGPPDQVRGVVYLPDAWRRMFEWIIPTSVYVLFWAASFFKLKEKQV